MKGCHFMFKVDNLKDHGDEEIQRKVFQKQKYGIIDNDIKKRMNL